MWLTSYRTSVCGDFLSDENLPPPAPKKVFKTNDAFNIDRMALKVDISILSLAFYRFSWFLNSTTCWVEAPPQIIKLSKWTEGFSWKLLIVAPWDFNHIFSWFFGNYKKNMYPSCEKKKLVKKSFPQMVKWLNNFQDIEKIDFHSFLWPVSAW